MTTALWWVRRDLRLDDNQALSAALERAERAVPVFVLDPVLVRSAWTGEKRLAFLLAGLRRLDEDLRARGSRLVIRRGRPTETLQALVAETGAASIHAAEDYSPYARLRDAAVAASLPLELHEGVVNHPPGAVTKADGKPYVVFTPFRRAWRALPPPRRADLMPPPEAMRPPPDLPSDALPDAPTLTEAVPFAPGEDEARRRLAAFVGGLEAAIHGYADGRDQLGVDGTSRLSPYLRFGMLSPRRAAVAAVEAVEAAEAAPSEGARRGAETWLSELVWREFYVHVLYHFPHVRRKSFRPEYAGIRWSDDETDFDAWRAGQTGFPIVDAAMRQLEETGWMHNRARMIAASFLVKDLLIDWRRGERHFMHHLVDGDPAANNGGWQWSAGTGTDAAPYFRVFNPVKQGERHDPTGAYVRRWVPELAGVPDAFLHAPWRMPPAAQRAAGVVIGLDYPTPVVDHAAARARAIAAFKNARASAP